MKFDYVETSLNNTPKQLVIFLHGYGADKNDLISLANEFQSCLPEAHFISINAPYKCEIGFGYQWFSLNDRTEEAMFKAIQPAAILLDRFIDEQLARLSLNDKDLILVGFSQGTMMALHVAPRRNEACNIIGYAGMIIEGEKLKNEAKSKPNILLIHGENDEVIPKINFENTVNFLKENNYSFEYNLLPRLAHNIDHNSIALTKNYLNKIFK